MGKDLRENPVKPEALRGSGQVGFEISVYKFLALRQFGVGFFRLVKLMRGQRQDDVSSGNTWNVVFGIGQAPAAPLNGFGIFMAAIFHECERHGGVNRHGGCRTHVTDLKSGGGVVSIPGTSCDSDIDGIGKRSIGVGGAIELEELGPVHAVAGSVSIKHSADSLKADP